MTENFRVNELQRLLVHQLDFFLDGHKFRLQVQRQKPALRLLQLCLQLLQRRFRFAAIQQRVEPHDAIDRKAGSHPLGDTRQQILVKLQDLQQCSMIRLSVLIAAHVLADRVVIADVDDVTVPDGRFVVISKLQVDIERAARVLDEVNLRRRQRVETGILPPLCALLVRPDIKSGQYKAVVVEK